MPEEKVLEAVKQGGTLAKVLGVHEDDFSTGGSKNVTRTLSGVVKLFRTYSHLSREKIEVAENLLDNSVICALCFRTTQRFGVLKCDPSTIKVHMDSHAAERGAAGAASAASKKRQTDLLEAGLQFMSTAESQGEAHKWASAALVAGGGGAAALPYTSIQKTLSPEMFIVMGAMRSGFCGPTKMREKLLPSIVDRLKLEHKKMLMGIENWALGIDGGSAQLVNGIKLMPLIALSPLLPRDMVLEVCMLPMHETAVIQASLINKYFVDTGLDKKRLQWLGVDNNQLNIKSVQIMNEKYGFNVRAARCIDHSLNLVFVAFLEPFELAFGMQKLLRHVRAYIKAGGGQSRRAALVEHALSLSGIDFTATRWTSFLRAVLYLMGKQSPSELKRAREALMELAEWGDESALEALEDEDVPRERWEQLHDALQSMGEDAKIAEKRRKKDGAPKEGPGDVREVKLDVLLESLVDIEMFAAFFIVSKMFHRVPALFTVLQGDERFEPKLEGLSRADKGSGRLNLAAAVRSVVEDLAALAEEESPLREALLVQTYEACEFRIKAALVAAKKDDEPLLPGKKKFDEADVPQYNDGATLALKAAMEKIAKVVILSHRLRSLCRCDSPKEEGYWTLGELCGPHCVVCGCGDANMHAVSVCRSPTHWGHWATQQWCDEK
jgi:hypothetical protein